MRARVARRMMALRLVWWRCARRSSCSMRERGKERGRADFKLFQIENCKYQIGGLAPLARGRENGRERGKR